MPPPKETSQSFLSVDKSSQVPDRYQFLLSTYHLFGLYDVNGVSDQGGHKTSNVAVQRTLMPVQFIAVGPIG